MRIAIIGASGRTGLHVLERGSERGYEVTSVVRNPDKLSGLTATETVVAKADARDLAGQTQALRGADAVVFALGPEGLKNADHEIQREGIATTLAAMKAAKVRRLVAVSASGHSTDGDGIFMRYAAKPIVQSILKDSFTDMKAMEQHIRESDTEWTIMRPPNLTDKPGHGKYKSRITKNPSGFSLTRADLADAILDALENPETVRQIVAVAN
jgi:putative NADH-flavin reductase